MAYIIIYTDTHKIIITSVVFLDNFYYYNFLALIYWQTLKLGALSIWNFRRLFGIWKTAAKFAVFLCQQSVWSILWTNFEFKSMETYILYLILSLSLSVSIHMIIYDTTISLGFWDISPLIYIIYWTLFAWNSSPFYDLYEEVLVKYL